MESIRTPLPSHNPSRRNGKHPVYNSFGPEVNNRHDSSWYRESKITQNTMQSLLTCSLLLTMKVRFLIISLYFFLMLLLKVIVHHFRKIVGWPLIFIIGTSFHLPRMSWTCRTHKNLVPNRIMSFGAENSWFFKNRALSIKNYLNKYFTRL